MRVLIDFAALRNMMSAGASAADGLTRLKVMHEFGDAELWASARSFFRLAGDLEEAVGAEDARVVLDDALSWLHVCSVGGEEVADALARGRGGFEGRLEATCAERIGAGFIVSDDVELRELSPIPSGSADDLMNFIAERFSVRYDVVDL